MLKQQVKIIHVRIKKKKRGETNKTKQKNVSNFIFKKRHFSL